MLQAIADELPGSTATDQDSSAPGHLATPEDAHVAYVARERELFGEFARTQ